MEVVAVSLPWLKGAISGPIRAYGLTVTAAHFFCRQGRCWWWMSGGKGGGVRKKSRHAGQVGGPAALFVPECMRLSAVDSTAGD